MKIWMATAMDERSADWRDRLLRARPDWDVRIWDPSQAPWQADYAVVWQPAPEFFTSQPKVKAVFNLGAGVEVLLRMETLPADVPVVRMEDVGMGRLMAEFALYGSLHIMRGFDRFEAQQRSRSWVPYRFPSALEWPVGVLGMGVIGCQVAQVLADYGFPTAGWARTARDVPGIDTFAGPEGLPAFLARTRLLINVLPLTPETENLIDRAMFDGLMADGYFINMARGHHVVDDDLLAALDSGRLRGALLDVFRDEPLPADHRYWSHPSVRVTPHIAGQTDLEAGCEQMVVKMEAMGRGEAVSGIVSRERGY